MTRESKTPNSEIAPAASNDESVMRLAAEELSVDKAEVVTGRVRVSTVTHEHEELVDELLAHERVEVERTPVGEQIASMPEIRTEGDVTIIPIVEEVLVVERRLVLKEEVRVRRFHETERFQDHVMLRSHEAVIVRDPPDATTG
jgi:uncharacterized protein (TIGR02271 family)